MRAVSRGNLAAPVALDALDSKKRSERDRARAHQLNPDPKKGSFEFTSYKHEEVKRRLDALFHGKCAYCETFYSASAPVDVEHFRPKGAVSEDPSHPGYWWLAMSWDNLLPSCIDCNRKRKQRVPSISTSLTDLFRSSHATRLNLIQSGKKDSFPIDGTGQRLLPEGHAVSTELALLLDPTRDNPEQHLMFHIDHSAPLGMVLPRVRSGVASERGSTSIQVYGLNRLGLVQDRTRLLRRLEFLGDLVVDLGNIIQDVERPEVAEQLRLAGVAHVPKRLQLLQDGILNEIREMAKPESPYCSMVRAWIISFQQRLS